MKNKVKNKMKNKMRNEYAMRMNEADGNVRKVLWACRISVRRVLLFQREYMFKMYVKMQDTEFKKLIQEFRRACK